MAQTTGIPQFRKYHYQQSWSSQASTNSYVDLGDSWDTTGLLHKTIEIKNTGVTNDIDYQILGSLDGTNYDISIDSGTISNSDYEVIDVTSFLSNSYVPYIKIQIKSTVSDSHSTVTCTGTAI